MMFPINIPPTAGLPVVLKDFLPGRIRLDNRLSKLLNIPHPIMCSSGTSALIVALKTIAQDNLQRDTVIVTSFSCPLVVMAIAYCGLKVKLCDTAPNSFDFDFQKLAALASQNTLAIISTHLGGQCADVLKATKIAQTVGAYIIEDAAQSLGADLNAAGESVGLGGDIGFFSLSVGKGLTTYSGGVLFAKNNALQKKMAGMAEGLLPASFFLEIKRSVQFFGYFLFYRPFLLPYVYGFAYRKAVRNDDWIRALGERFSINIPMHALGLWRQRRAANAVGRLSEYFLKTTAQAEKRVKILESLTGLSVIKNSNGAKATWPFIMVLLPTSVIRDKALGDLNELGLGVTRLYAYALNNYDYLKPYLATLDRQPGLFPVAKDFSERLLTISNSLALKDAQFDEIIKIIKSALKEEPVSR
jgi:perosamine synthetase